MRSTTTGDVDPAGTAPADDTAASPPLSSKLPGLGLASLVLVSSVSSVDFACLRGLPPAVGDEELEGVAQVPGSELPAGLVLPPREGLGHLLDDDNVRRVQDQAAVLVVLLYQR